MKLVLGIILLTFAANMAARGFVNGLDLDLDPGAKSLFLIAPYLVAFFGTVYAAMRLATHRAER